MGAGGDDLTGEAIDWLVALDHGTADQEAFEAWRSADPRHAAVFAQVAATWRRTSDRRIAAVIESPAADPEPESEGEGAAIHGSALQTTARDQRRGSSALRPRTYEYRPAAGARRAGT